MGGTQREAPTCLPGPWVRKPERRCYEPAPYRTAVSQGGPQPVAGPLAHGGPSSDVVTCATGSQASRGISRPFRERPRRLALLQRLFRCRRRTPAPPPFSSMNSTPAASRARRTARSLAGVIEVARSISSARRIVRKLTADCWARSCALQPTSARAARIWTLTSGGFFGA